MASNLNEIEGTTYIVTEDLSTLISDWCQQISKPAPRKEFFDNILERLCKALEAHCFMDSEIRVFPLQMDSFSDVLRRSHPDHAKEFWICLDEVFPKACKPGEYDFCLSISRLVDEDGNDLGRGARPESPYDTLEEQISRCAEHYRRTIEKRSFPVVLVDDGTFDGHTVVTVLGLLAREGILVETVRLGVAKLNGIKNITRWEYPLPQSKKAEVHRVRFLGCSKLCPPIFDWICERDFFPGVPFGGRALGDLQSGRLIPKRLLSGSKSVRQAYLEGWGRPREWAGLLKGIKRFTWEAIGLSIELWEHLENLWSEKILVRTLPSLPHKLYSSNSDRLEENFGMLWLQILRDEQARIPG